MILEIINDTKIEIEILILTKTKSKLDFSYFIFNTPSQQERVYQILQSCFYGTQIFLLTKPLSKYLHLVPLSECTTTT